MPITFTKSVKDRSGEDSLAEEHPSESPGSLMPLIPLKSTPKRRSNAPAQRASKTVRFSRPAPLQVHNRRRSTRGTFQEEPFDDEARIPKPKGEVGHPGTHGYSLYPTLNWEKVVYEAVQKHVQKLADAKLAVSEGISKQDDDLILDLIKKVADKYPILNRYIDYWPARDMLKQYLKNTSGKSRREERIIAAHGVA
ncbi:hypothetical protein M422DRAFT_277062 [Sphaerobolus stellatus SS14]|uniref:Uncharacterized protein n=1 Tax=Sphaerobolus stellatus (strain SS14) TaxID=990650 RepID=A0A0C9U0L3_SPHS4|nr:hypothetical protein M422DRAFT_277062 [Sphaerobolus stellatus SS14]